MKKNVLIGMVVFVLSLVALSTIAFAENETSNNTSWFDKILNSIMGGNKTNLTDNTTVNGTNVTNMNSNGTDNKTVNNSKVTQNKTVNGTKNVTENGTTRNRVLRELDDNARVMTNYSQNITNVTAHRATLGVVQDGNHVVLTCNVEGFRPTGYDWYFKDGAYMLDISSSTQEHTYATDGLYVPACTAADGNYNVAIAWAKVVIGNVSQNDTWWMNWTANSTTGNLNDAQVLGVLKTMNAGEIEVAQFVLPKLVTQQARDYANKIISDHGAAMGNVMWVAGELNLPPQESNVSQRLDHDTQQFLKELASRNGSDVDRYYMQRESLHHQQGIDVNMNVLMPSTDNARIEMLLRDDLNLMTSHLQMSLALMPQTDDRDTLIVTTNAVNTSRINTTNERVNRTNSSEDDR